MDLTLTQMGVDEINRLGDNLRTASTLAKRQVMSAWKERESLDNFPGPQKCSPAYTQNFASGQLHRGRQGSDFCQL